MYASYNNNILNIVLFNKYTEKNIKVYDNINALENLKIKWNFIYIYINDIIRKNIIVKMKIVAINHDL